MKKHWLISIILAVALLMIAIPVAAASPGEPPGLAKAIAAQEKHQEVLLDLPGVAGVGVSLDESNQPAIIVFTENSGVGGMPAFIDGIPVKVVVSGKFTALPRPEGVGKVKNNPPKVTIISPVDGANYPSGSDVNFTGSASDKQDGNLTNSIIWTTEGQGSVTGGSGSFVGLADGLHTITASVTDSGGLTASASVTINIGSPQYKTTDRWPRPVPIGVSTGHPAITAGTIGARVTDGTYVYALSNNHVYADENNADIGDNVLQPGTYDYGQDPDDAIGTLYDFESIIFSRVARNTIDAAIALVSTSTLDNATPSGGYGTPKSTPADAYVGMPVQKYGRTTMLTAGTVYAVNATVKVGYDSGVARFVNQIIITPGTFSAGGDSGSLIVGYGGSADRQPVGLLFAGSTSYTIANPIQAVLDRFGVTIDGPP